jgi:hypothetical protein
MNVQPRDERWLYATLGALLMLLGFSLASTQEYVDCFACLAAGAGIIINALRSLLKKHRQPYKRWRVLFLYGLIGIVCIFLYWRTFLRHS